MSASNETCHPDVSGFYPVDWDEKTLRLKWIEILMGMMDESAITVPLKRIQYQIEQTAEYLNVLKRWSAIDGPARIDAWKRLLECSERVVKEILPTCVQCGECCRRGSPTLMLEDLEVLRKGKIPWNQVFTLRRGEPVRSPFQEELSFLLDERIKIREKAGTQECVFLDSATDLCTIYHDRPLQCRAQACWDPKHAQRLVEQPHLTRRDIFEEVELLLDLVAEHDRRCSFEKLDAAFKHLEETKGESISEVLDLLAYEDHFRHFLAERMHIPQNELELVFGKSFTDLVILFGFRVEREPDGSRCLVLDRS
jgi:Fe-S-cluster containining protein